MRRQHAPGGFTIIELIVVITILCILAAFAVPRFSTLEVEARSAAASALATSLSTNVAMTHALWIAQGQPDVIVIDGREVSMDYGYPSSTSIDDTLASLDGFAYRAGPIDGLFSKTDSASNAIPSCAVSYTAAVAIDTAPAIRLDTDGC